MKDWLKRFGGALDWPNNISGRGTISDPFGDWDKDGVPNMNDCAPKNPKKQDSGLVSKEQVIKNMGYSPGPDIRPLQTVYATPGSVSPIALNKLEIARAEVRRELNTSMGMNPNSPTLPKSLSDMTPKERFVWGETQAYKQKQEMDKMIKPTQPFSSREISKTTIMPIQPLKPITELTPIIRKAVEPLKPMPQINEKIQKAPLTPQELGFIIKPRTMSIGGENVRIIENPRDMAPKSTLPPNTTYVTINGRKVLVEKV